MLNSCITIFKSMLIFGLSEVSKFECKQKIRKLNLKEESNDNFAPFRINNKY